MDLREIKKLTAFARRAGIKSLKINGFEIELHDSALSPQIQKRSAQVIPDPIYPSPLSAPTLDQVNAYIYGPPEEHA